MRMKRMKWTQQDDAKLAALYATMSAIDIAAVMGVNRSSIKNRVHKLGLNQRSRNETALF